MLRASEICQSIQNHMHSLRETLRQYLGYPMRNRLLYQVKTCGAGCSSNGAIAVGLGAFSGQPPGTRHGAVLGEGEGDLLQG